LERTVAGLKPAKHLCPICRCNQFIKYCLHTTFFPSFCLQEPGNKLLSLHQRIAADLRALSPHLSDGCCIFCDCIVPCFLSFLFFSQRFIGATCPVLYSSIWKASPLICTKVFRWIYSWYKSSSASWYFSSLKTAVHVPDVHRPGLSGIKWSRSFPYAESATL